VEGRRTISEINEEWEALPADEKIRRLERSKDYWITELLYGERIARNARRQLETYQIRINLIEEEPSKSE
jgi:hypothetical protein